MNGINYVLDTNIILYLLAGDKLLWELLENSHPAISIITEMELLSFRKMSREEEKTILAFLNECRIVGLDEAVKERAIAIRRSNGLKLPDSIIVATALINNCTLLTADKRLSGIGDLNCFLYEK